LIAGDFAMAERSRPTAATEGDFVWPAEAATLWELFCERVRRSPDAIAYKDWDSTNQKWRNHTWRSIAARVAFFRSALAQDGLAPGDHVALLLPNGIDWVCFDIAAHGSGLVVVGLYSHDPATSNAAILGHSDARLLLLDTEARWQSLAAFRSEFPLLRHVWIRDTGGDLTSPPTGPSLRSIADILASECNPAPPHPAAPGDIA